MRIRSRIQRQIHSLSTFTFSSHPSPPKISPRKPYPSRNLASAMASDGNPENISTVVANEDDVKFGFKRQEMYSSNLACTVEPPYDRHVFLCYKSHESWPSRLEDSDADLLPKLLAVALKARKSDIKVKTRFTVCEGLDGGDLSDGDVLIFPEMIKYRDLKEPDVEKFVEDVLVNGNPWSAGTQEVLTGSYVFVCAHNNRDRRCGVCGPVLIDKFRKEIESKGVKGHVFVTACSHIGGHKYAGNAIIFSADAEGKIAGHWYGYVTPDDVPELLDRHIGKGEIIERIWRGQMGASVEKANDIQRQELPNGIELNSSEERQQGSGSVEMKENISSCCQGSQGFSCCRDESFEKQEGKGGGKFSKCIGKWEQHDVLTAIGVVGAVAVVAVAYGLYRRSK